jgi:hypothetical protein
MQTRYDLLQQMSALVDTLLENAERLNESVKHTLAEEELIGLQRRQEEIIANIEGVNSLLKEKKLVDDKRADSLQKELKQKLIQFQERNRKFVKLIQDRHRLIQQKTLPSELIHDLE